MTERTYTIQEFLTIQSALRKELHKPEETFSPQALAGMLRDEVKALHEKGYSDASIANLIREASGHLFPVGALSEGALDRPDYWKSQPHNVDPDTSPKPAVSPDREQPGAEPAAPTREPAPEKPTGPTETPLQPSPAEDPGHGVPDENPAPSSPPDLPSSTPNEYPQSTPVEIPSQPSVAPSYSNPSIAPTIE